MKRFTAALTGHALAVLAALQLFAHAAYPQGEPSAAARTTRPGEVIVRLRASVDADSFVRDPRLRGLRLRKGRPLVPRSNIWLMYYTPHPEKANEEIAALRSHPGVERAQFNHRVALRAAPIEDPEFLAGHQWALQKIDAVGAWEITEGGATALGDEIVVAVIDIGFDLAHEDIEFWKNLDDPIGDANDDCEADIDPNTGEPYDELDDDCNGYADDYDGWNVMGFLPSGSIPPRAHGTEVAGVAAAIGNALGISGVNRNVAVMPIVALDDTFDPYEADVIAGYGYVLEMRIRYNASMGAEGANVVVANSSFGLWGDPSGYSVWCSLYDDMGAEGILSVSAVANYNGDVDGILQDDIPSVCPSDYLITATNTTPSDELNTDSGSGWSAVHVDLGAPGTGILSTSYPGDYEYTGGTSFAAAHVTGAIALMHAAAPESVALAYREAPWEVALDFKSILLGSVDPVPALQGKTVSGGRLNVREAVGEIDDAVPDAADNCSNAANPAQDDSDQDDCGNLCDADYDDDGSVGFSDFGEFIAAFGTHDEEKCHVEPIPGCMVGFSDFGFLVARFGQAPGPSGTTAGSAACP